MLDFNSILEYSCTVCYLNNTNTNTNTTTTTTTTTNNNNNNEKETMTQAFSCEDGPNV